MVSDLDIGDDGDNQAFDGVVVLIGISVVGYLLSCVSYLREVLEGNISPRVWNGSSRG